MATLAAGAGAFALAALPLATSPTSASLSVAVAQSAAHTAKAFSADDRAAWRERLAPVPAAPLDPGASLNQTACPRVADCLSVGQYFSAAGIGGLLATDVGDTWRTVPAPVPAGMHAADFVLGTVACPPAAASFVACAAGGVASQAPGGDGDAVLETRSTAGWVPAAAPGAAAGPGVPGFSAGDYSSVDDITCPLAGSCVAVASTNEDSRAVILQQLHGRWAAVPCPAAGRGGDRWPTGAPTVAGGLQCARRMCSRRVLPHVGRPPTGDDRVGGRRGLDGSGGTRPAGGRLRPQRHLLSRACQQPLCGRRLVRDFRGRSHSPRPHPVVVGRRVDRGQSAAGPCRRRCGHGGDRLPGPDQCESPRVKPRPRVPAAHRRSSGRAPPPPHPLCSSCPSRPISPPAAWSSTPVSYAAVEECGVAGGLAASQTSATVVVIDDAGRLHVVASSPTPAVTTTGGAVATTGGAVARSAAAARVGRPARRQARHAARDQSWLGRLAVVEGGVGPVRAIPAHRAVGASPRDGVRRHRFSSVSCSTRSPALTHRPIR